MTYLVRELAEIGIDHRFAVDVITVARGVRPLGLLHAPRETEPALRKALGAAGLEVVAHRLLLRKQDPESREGILREPRAEEHPNFSELWYARHGVTWLPGVELLFRNPGLHLGYPPCCVAEWERIQSQRDLYRRYIFETTCGYWEINRLAAIFQSRLLIPDFFPCSMNCENACAFARPVIAIAEEILDQAWVREAVRWMKAPIAYHSGSLYAFPSWRLIGTELELPLADATKVPLAAVGRFGEPPQQGFQLVWFRHLASAEKATLIGSGGTRTSIALEREEL